ncbi:MAG: hypothetical protein ACJ79K_05450 [Gemmatimonadaceae bacterium]
MSAESVTPPERGTLPRELIDFLIELSIALQKFAIYPTGHPMLATTVERLERRLRPLLDQRSTLSLGVARNQLVIEGVATDEHHAVLRELAERLHHHHLGALKISQRVTPTELREMLVTIGIDQGKEAMPIGLLPIEELPQWPSIRLYPLAYEHLELLSEDEDNATPPVAGVKTRAAGARAARLWVGLARAALAGREAPSRKASTGATSTETSTPETPPTSAATAEAEETAAADPAEVARAIDEHQREEAYDQVIVGYLLQIADELRSADGRDAVALRRRVSGLLGSVKPETLRNLLTMGNDAGQRQKFVLDATQGMAVDAVIELLRAAADVSKQTISHSMLRLLSKLAVHAEHHGSDRRADADAALRENVRMLVGQWTLDDPNPDAYRAVLEGMSRSRPRLDGSLVAAYPVEDERLVQMALEIGVGGDGTWRAVETMVARRRLSPLVAMLERSPRPRIAQQIWDRIATPERIRAMVEEAQPDWDALERLVARVGLGAADALTDALEETEDPRRRGHIVSLLSKLGDDVGDAIVRRLSQSGPAVQAQLLVLLGKLAILPAGFDPAEWARNRNPSVRREAIRILCRRAATREQGITLGLVDVDERAVLAALNEAASDCPRSAVPILMSRVDRDDIPASLRALAIRAVASVKSPDVVDWVLRFVMIGRKRFFGGERLAPKTPELLAALIALGTYWSRDKRVLSTLERAAKSPDAEIRSAAMSVLRPLPNARPSVPRPVEEDG